MGLVEIFRLFPRALTEPMFWFLVLLTATSWAVPWGLQELLLRRMAPERRDRGWNAATRGAAVLLFPLPALGMLAFAWVTRKGRGRRSAVVAIGWGVLLSVVALAVTEAIGQLLMLTLGVTI